MAYIQFYEVLMVDKIKLQKFEIVYLNVDIKYAPS